MQDQEIAKYIINYFHQLLSKEEKMAIRHWGYTYKLEHATHQGRKMEEVYRENGLLTSDPDVLDLLKDGYEAFELNVANRVLSDSADSVYFNNCPHCRKLARTPFARQCPHCYTNWHDLVAGQFKLHSSFQVTGRPFFLLGRVTKGEIIPGNFMDLIILGLNKRPVIEVIEFARHSEFNELTALGTTGLSEEDKEFLINLGAFGNPFDILSKR
jgi:hypothetical protein